MPISGQDTNTLATGLASLAKGLFPDPQRQATMLYRRAQADAYGANAEFDRQRTVDAQRISGAAERLSAIIADPSIPPEQRTTAMYAQLALMGERGLQHGPGFASGFSGTPGSGLTPQQQARMQVAAGKQTYRNTEYGALTDDLKLGENQTGYLSPDRQAALGARAPVVMGQRTASANEVVAPPPGSGLPAMAGRPSGETAKAAAYQAALEWYRQHPDKPLPPALAQMLATAAVAAQTRGDAARDVAGTKAGAARDVAGTNAKGRVDAAGVAAEARLGAAGLAANAARDVAGTRADAARDVAGANAKGRVDAAGVAAAARVGAAGLAADATRDAAKARGDAARDVAKTKAGATLDAAKTAADGRAEVARGNNQTAIEVANIRASRPTGQQPQGPAIRAQNEIDRRIAAVVTEKYGAKLSAEVLLQLSEKGLAGWRQHGDVARAVNDVMKGLPPPGSKDVVVSGQFNPFSDNRITRINPPEAPAPAPTPARAPAQPRAPAQQGSSGNAPNNAVQNDLPPQARAQLTKEGERVRFSNGQVWTLRNGQPVRVE